VKPTPRGLDQVDPPGPQQERLPGVLVHESVDDRERLVTFDRGRHVPAHPGGPIRVLVVEDGEPDSRVALELRRLPALCLREEDDPSVLDAAQIGIDTGAPSGSGVASATKFAPSKSARTSSGSVMS
jgi:hypothetical protein